MSGPKKVLKMRKGKERNFIKRGGGTTALSGLQSQDSWASYIQQGRGNQKILDNGGSMIRRLQSED